MALAWGHNGTAPWASRPGTMMGGQSGHNPMMGSGGHPSMMGGQNGVQNGATPQATPLTGVTQVQMSNFAFVPANMRVRVGTTVTWTNQDSAPHTVTFRNGMMGRGSSMMQQGQSFSYTFTTRGTYTYYCSVHPYMTATITVTP
jgi:amicyanin